VDGIFVAIYGLNIRGLVTAILSFVVVIASGAPPVNLLRVPNGGIQPQVVKDSAGTVHLLYYLGDPANGDLYYVRSKDDGNSWSAPLHVNSVAGDAIAVGNIRGGQLAIGKNQRPYVVWLGSKPLPGQQAQAGMSLLFSRLKDDGSGFEAERNLQGHTLDMDGGASVAASETGDVFLVWHASAVKGGEERDRKVWVSHSADEGKTFETEHEAWPKSTGACGCCSLKALYGSGKLRVFYRSAENNQNRDPYLLTSADKGATFSGEKLSDWVANTCPMSTFALDDFHGKLFAAWERKGVIQWTTTGGAPSRGVGVNAKYPAIVTNGDGETLVVWTENMGWQKGGSVVWQVYDRNGKKVGSQNGEKDGVPVWSLAAAFTRADGSFVIFY